jgi:hypothetical protein
MGKNDESIWSYKNGHLEGRNNTHTHRCSSYQNSFSRLLLGLLKDGRRGNGMMIRFKW